MVTTDESKAITGDNDQIISQSQNDVLNTGDNFGIERSVMELHKGCCEKMTVSIVAFIPGKDPRIHQRVQCAAVAS